MEKQELRKLIAAVKAGRVPRRAFVQRVVALGLTAPSASRLLAHAGMAEAAASDEYKPTRAGGGGALKLLFWQAPTLLNPHFATGTKDQEGSRIFYEPLAAWDADGNLAPVLAAERSQVGRVLERRHSNRRSSAITVLTAHKEHLSDVRRKRSSPGSPYWRPVGWTHPVHSGDASVYPALLLRVDTARVTKE